MTLRLRLAGGMLVLLLAACTNSPTMKTDEPLPNWRGPVVHCRHLGDRGLLVELTAPTAGHKFTLQDIAVRGGRADAEFTWQQPTLAVTAQVVTPHRIEVGADKLGDARAVWVWVTDGSGARRLALATARP